MCDIWVCCDGESLVMELLGGTVGVVFRCFSLSCFRVVWGCFWVVGARALCGGYS